MLILKEQYQQFFTVTSMSIEQLRTVKAENFAGNLILLLLVTRGNRQINSQCVCN